MLILAAAVVAVVMFVTWLVSLAARDASLVDLVWGVAFVVVTAAVGLAGDGASSRRLLLAVLVGVWGLRLSGYLAWRNLGHGEDYRYQAMRKKYGDRFPLISLVVVFGLQGVLVWVVSLPVQLAADAAEPSGIGLLAWLGIALWALGLGFETIGDAQLSRFKADPANKGQVMDRGLWRYTRHPNYFGDATLWWGIWLVAASSWVAVGTVIGPLAMTYLLAKGTGKPLTEKSMSESKPGYGDYVRRTSGFVPLPPRDL